LWVTPENGLFQTDLSLISEKVLLLPENSGGWQVIAQFMDRSEANSRLLPEKPDRLKEKLRGQVGKQSNPELGQLSV